MWGSTKANSKINAQLKHGYDIHVCVLQEYQFCGCHRPVDIPDQLHCYSLCCFFWFLDFFRLLFLFSWLVRRLHWLRCSFLWSWGNPNPNPKDNRRSQIKLCSKPGVDFSTPRTGYSLFGPHLRNGPICTAILNSSSSQPGLQVLQHRLFLTESGFQLQ